MELAVGVALMLIGLVVGLVGRSKSKRVRVAASNGSVAVGGKNTGFISNTNIGVPAAAPHGTHWLTVVAIVVELVGIAVVLWHAWHMAGPK